MGALPSKLRLPLPFRGQAEMRRTPGVALGQLLVAGSIAGMVATNPASATLAAHAAGGLTTITVSPTHGRAAASFAATYTVSPCPGAAGLTVGFSWNALPPAGQVLGTALTNGSCRGTVSATPAVNSSTHAAAAPGTYRVFGYIALPTGLPAPNSQASVIYTVDVTPTPTATKSATATAKPTSHATSSATSAPTAPTAVAVGPIVVGAIALALAAALLFLLYVFVRRRRARGARDRDRAA